MLAIAFKLLIVLSFACFILTSCTGGNGSPEAAPAARQEAVRSGENRPAPGPDESMFRIEVTVPPGITAEQPFKAEGALINKSPTAWEMEHGADMFTYSIYDGNDRPVLQEWNTIAVTSIGIGTTLSPDAAYSYDGREHTSIPLNELTVKEPGEYTVVAHAQFTIRYEGKSYHFKISSDPYEFNVMK